MPESGDMLDQPQGILRVLFAQYSRALANDSNRPKILGQVIVHQIVVRQGEVALHSPLGAPGIPEKKPLFRVIIADGENGMAGADFLVLNRHRAATSAGHLRRVKALIDGKSKHEWVAGSETRPQRWKRAPNALVTYSGMIPGIGITSSQGFLSELTDA